MRNSQGLELLPFDPEIKRTFRRLRKERTQARLHQVVMAERPEEEPTKSLRDYAAPHIDDVHSSIIRLAIQANTFEIKLIIIHMIQTSIQFGGMLDDDPNAYIVNFLEICDTFKHNGVSLDASDLDSFLFHSKTWQRVGLCHFHLAPSPHGMLWHRNSLLSIFHQPRQLN